MLLEYLLKRQCPLFQLNKQENASAVLATLQEAGWEAEVDTVDLHLTPQGTAADLARSQLRIGPAAVLIAEREADDATKEAIVKDLTATYETMTEEGRVKVPAQIHFFTARPKG